MSRQKTRWIFLLALSVLVAVLLSGCQFGKNVPFYSLEEYEDYSEVLYIDGIKYQGNSIYFFERSSKMEERKLKH